MEGTKKNYTMAKIDKDTTLKRIKLCKKDKETHDATINRALLVLMEKDGIKEPVQEPAPVVQTAPQAEVKQEGV